MTEAFATPLPAGMRKDAQGVIYIGEHRPASTEYEGTPASDFCTFTDRPAWADEPSETLSMTVFVTAVADAGSVTMMKLGPFPVDQTSLYEDELTFLPPVGQGRNQLPLKPDFYAVQDQVSLGELSSHYDPIQLSDLIAAPEINLEDGRVYGIFSVQPPDDTPDELNTEDLLVYLNKFAPFST